MPDDVFSDQESASPTDPQSSSDGNILDTIVGEGKKFKTVEDLARSAVEKDQYISQVEGENGQLREEIKRVGRIEDRVDELTNKMKETREQPNQRPEEHTTPALTPEKVTELVENVVTQREVRNTARENRAVANQELVKAFGSADKAREVVKTRSTEMGMTLAALGAIAEQSPTAFLRLVGTQGQTVPQDAGDKLGLNQSDVILNNEEGTPQPGTKAYFEAKKKEMGRKFYTNVALQQQLFRAKQDGTYVE